MKILIIDDGKAGHSQQSFAVADQIKKCIELHGTPKSLVDVTSLTISLSKAQRWLLECILTWLPILIEYTGQHPISDVRNIAKTRPTILISCGKSASIVAALYSSPNCTKICIHYPGSYFINKFHLLITPEHDSYKLPKFSNVIKTKLAICSGNIIQSSQQPLPKKRVGILLGGSNKSYRFTQEICTIIANEISALQTSLGLEIYWTTSRRTPKNLESQVALALKRNDSKSSHITQPADLLSSCEWVFVSGDSISMISQALAQGCKVTVFTLPHRFLSSRKHEGFIKMLHRANVISTCSYAEISSQALPENLNSGQNLYMDDLKSLKTKLTDILCTHEII